MKTILLVEDEAIIAMAEKMTLEKSGYKVITAGTGEKALKIMDTNPDIDLVLMDINLGDGIDGTETAKRILEKFDLPLIFLSAHIEQDVVKKTQGITSYGYIVKDSGEVVMNASIKMAFKLFDARMKEKEKERELRKNEEKYRTLFENMAQGVFYQKADGEIIDANPAALEMFGLTERQILGKTSLDPSWKVMDKDGSEIKVEEHPSQKALRTGKPVHNRRVAVYNPQKRDFVWLITNAIPQFRSGEDRPYQVFVTLHDITQLKRMEDLLQWEKEKAQAYLDLAGTMIVAIDREGKVSRINPKGCEILESDEREIIGRDWFDNFVPERNREEIRTIFRKIIRDKDVGPYEIVDEHLVQTKTGKEKMIFWHNTVIKDKKGKITGVLSSGEDVTKWVEAQEKIRISEEKYRALYNNAPLPYQSLDQKGCFIDVNTAWLKALGYAKEEVIGKKFTEFLHPDWKPHFEKNFLKFKRAGYVHGIQFKVRHKDGHYRDISFEGRIGLHQDGSFRQTYCVFHDITEQKQAEEALRKSEKRFRTIYNNTPVMLHSIDPGGRLVSVSDFWLKTLGYERDEVIGRKSIDFLTEESRRHAQEEALPEFFKTGVSWNIPYEFVRKNGEVLDILMSAIAERDEYGNIVRTLAVLVDVTEKKRTEKLIRSLLEEKELLLKEVHHRIKNNFSFMESLLSLQRHSVNNSETKAALQDAVSRVSSMRVLYDKLLTAAEHPEISFADYLSDLIDMVVRLFPSKTKIKVEKNIDGVQLHSKILFPLGIIVNELLTNIMKYAFSDRREGMVNVRLEKNENQVYLIVKDNGKGMPEGFNVEQTEGFGLTLVKMLSKQLNGHFSIKRQKGTEAVLVLNL